MLNGREDEGFEGEKFKTACERYSSIAIALI